MTAVEVVASTLLASMLMVAMLGVLRGLKAQEAALEIRNPTPVWQSTLDSVLQRDLVNSHTYTITPTALILKGHAAKDPQSGTANWLPSTIVYELAQDGERNWLVRHGQDTRELVLADVTSIRIGILGEEQTETLPPVVTSVNEVAITSGLTVQFWDSNNSEKEKPREEPLYGYHFRRP